MFYSLLFLTALLSQLQGSSAVSTQTRSMSDSTAGRVGSIAALNNLVVIGDPSSGSNVGDISFSFYDYLVTESTFAVTANNFVQARSTVNNNGKVVATVTAAAATDLAGNTFLGLGHAVAIADPGTVFVSQANLLAQTGRVVVYQGNVSSFKQTQVLIPYDGKHRMDSEAMFGESISAKHGALAVGCQNCNSSAPVFSGAVYVYRPTKEGSWSETQTLTAEGVLFLGERVAMHENVLVAAGDDQTGPGDALTDNGQTVPFPTSYDARRLHTSNANHDFSNVANTVVVFEEGHHGKFEQRQVITTKSGSFRESITGITVFDETIAITTMGTDLPGAGSAAARDKVYIYYPMNKRYGLEPEHPEHPEDKGKPKPKPSPQQWTNIQILTSAVTTDLRNIFGGPDTSISMNTLMYVVVQVAPLVGLAKAIRPCLSCKFEDPVVTAILGAATGANTAVNNEVMIASDSSAFYGYQTAAVADSIADPVPNNMFDDCLTIMLIDQFSDGWGTASLVVTSPSGHEEKFTLQCTSANPQHFKYCPQSQTAGEYHIHIDEPEAPFAWEINYKVAAGTTWYVGDRHTHMDFLWDEKYGDFHVCATKGVLPTIATCDICDPNKPTGKHRSLSNLRSLHSLHHKGETQSPTISSAPTITTTGYTGYTWNQFVFVAATKWFTSDYYGHQFFISDQDGKHLHQTGTRCTTGAVKEVCWVELPDGDYTLRVGGSADTTSLTYAFCESSVDINADTELKFTVLDQQCYAGLFTTTTNKCLTNYKSDWFLNVDIMLSGAAESLSISDESTLKVALSETMLSVLGSSPSAARVEKEEVTSTGVKVSVVLQFETVPDSTALANFGKDTSSAGSLLKYELIGAQALSANFLNGGVSGVAIVSASTDGDARDMSKIDESSFQTVTDHVWKTASVEAPSDNFNVYAKYVAEGAYALVAVAAVLAVSLFAKRAMSKTAVIEEDVQA